MDGKINDHQGNLFTPSKAQARLYRAGWRICEKTRMGMCKIIKWVDPETGTVWNQGIAFDILKDRSKNK